jgi:PKD repeat protein
MKRQTQGHPATVASTSPARRQVWSVALAAALTSLCAGLGATEAPPLPRFVAGAVGIDCSTTPFGLHTPLAQDIEGVQLIESTSLNVIDEHRATTGSEQPPYTRVFRANRPAALAGASLQRAVNIDLDGSGRDEIAAAYRMGDGSLRIAIYQRGANTVLLVDSWSLNQTFSQVELAAGDLDGSTDGRQELGVMLRTLTGAVQVRVLQGATGGVIAQADNVAAGSWQRTGPVGASIGFTAGDLLLSGHDQLAVISELNPGGSRQFAYDLLEYLPSTSELPITGSAVNIGARTFTSNVGGTFGSDFNGVMKIEADAGDVVDSAAAELVLHIQHRQSGFDYITQRLLHFPTTRDENNAITGIALFDRTPGTPGDDAHFDASQIVQAQNENGPASFEAAIAQIDATPQREIVLARSNPSDNLTVAAYQPTVDRKAGFTFQTTGRTVNFRNTSTGGATTYTWNFGDNSGTLQGIDVTHQYTSDNTFNVTLTATYPDSSTRTYAVGVLVNSAANSGGMTPDYSYGLGAAKYSATYAVASFNDLSFVNVAAGDMNRDGTYEALTMARNTTGRVLRSRWQLTDPVNAASFAGTHAEETNSGFNSMTAMELVGSDFDGDSLNGMLGDNCLRVFEPQLRQVIWLPPYFGVEQAAAGKLALWGKSTTGTTSSEKRSGSYTSHDVSGYLGVEVGTPDNLPYTVEASVAVTAGANWQKSKGEFHGEESSLSVDEGQEQDQGEALVITEETAFNCYAYDVTRASVIDPNSKMRLCERIEDSRIVSGSDALEWDTAVPAAGVQLLGHKPAQWVPLHRDWSSIALFKPVTTNTAFDPSHGVENLTDGQFDSEAFAGGPRVQPYVEIDLGSLRDISNIRVFPAAGDALDLRGFNVFASRTPMATSGVPTGAGITTFAPETEDAVSYDRWNIWTRNPASPSQLLRARYIRLQHPGSTAVNLRVAEIQVFGDVHLDPPAYPQAVCDPVAKDGRFRALVWNPATAKFAEIQMRGDLLWNGSGSWPQPQSGDTFAACSNHGQLPTRDIWSTTAVGASATNTWNLSSESGSLTGTVTSIDNSTRVGAQFDFTAGFIVKVIAGAAYEFTKGITKENQNSTYWGSGLEMGGAIGGFANTALNTSCRYRPRPYAHTLPDRSDTGYLHEAYAVDYVVQEGATGLWKRNGVPNACFGDRLFADGFE